MWQRILSFVGWLWAGFFVLIGFASLTQNPAIALTCIIWGLIFLPPLFRLTSSYAIGWNILGRIAALFITLVIGALLSPSQPQVTQTTPPIETSPASIATPTPIFTPTVEPAPTLEPDIAPEPEIIETPKPKTVITPAPEIIEVPESKPPASISQPVAPPPQSNPNAPVRAAVSGSCDCPYDTDKRGRSCGKRSAYSRPSGRSPVCYIRDQ